MGNNNNSHQNQFQPVGRVSTIENIERRNEEDVNLKTTNESVNDNIKQFSYQYKEQMVDYQNMLLTEPCLSQKSKDIMKTEETYLKNYTSMNFYTAGKDC